MGKDELLVTESISEDGSCFSSQFQCIAIGGGRSRLQYPYHQGCNNQISEVTVQEKLEDLY